MKYRNVFLTIFLFLFIHLVILFVGRKNVLAIDCQAATSYKVYFYTVDCENNYTYTAWCIPTGKEYSPGVCEYKTNPTSIFVKVRSYSFGRCTNDTTTWYPSCAEDSGGGGGGGGGGNGPTCEQQNSPVGSTWLMPSLKEDTFNINDTLPLNFRAMSIDALIGGSSSIDISASRWGWQDPVYEDICEFLPGNPCNKACSLGEGCVFQKVPSKEQCDNNPSCVEYCLNSPNCSNCCVYILLPDIMPALKAISAKRRQDPLGDWKLSVRLKPNWGYTCKYERNISLVDCEAKCPADRGAGANCVVTDAMCAAANSNDTGYKAVSTGECKGNDAKCYDDDGCSGQKVCDTSTCYKADVNTTPPPPTKPTMTVDGFTFPLSVTEFTRIKKPLPGQPDDAVTLSVTAPSGTYRNPRFSFNCENYGLNDEWKENDGWNNCNGLEGEDQCLVNTTADTITYKGVSKTPIQVLKEGASGIVAVRFHSQNKCNDDYKHSSYINPRYKVDNLPKVTEITVTGTPNNTQGCEADKYTGTVVNRELTITVTGEDKDGVDDINGLSLWLVKRGEGDLSNDKNKIVPVGPGITKTSPTEIGIFLGDYDQNPTAGLTRYKAINPDNTLLGWGRDAASQGQQGTPRVQDENGNILIEEFTASRETIGLTKKYTVTLHFPESEDTPISGTYDIYAGFSDIFTYSEKPTGGIFLDSQNVKQTTASWKFDFIKPQVTTPSLTNHGQQNIEIRWTSADTGPKFHTPSGIPANHTVINAYITGGTALPTNILFNPDGPNPSSVTPKNEVPTEENIGILDPLTSGYIFPTPGGGTKSQMVNIGKNDNGILTFYITVFDSACNKTTSTITEGQRINLDKWITTKGGIFYSKGTVSYPVKPVSGINYNLGTELTSTASNAIGVVQEYPLTPIENPAVAKSITDINNSPGLFNKLKENFGQVRESGSLANATMNGNTLTCTNQTGCVYQANSIGNITYTGKIIVYSESEITITDDIKKKSPSDVMFIFSSNGIKINPHSIVGTEQIDAFLLSGKGINIPSTDTPTEEQEQVLIEGGVIALADGLNTGPAFLLKKSLGLENLNKPTLVVNYHPKYAVASELFFGLQVNAYKREVGFKPL